MFNPPFGVKVLWFVLSLTGLLGCCAMTLGLGRTTGTYWPWILYCSATLVLQGIFCIGMAWKMDPMRMPSSFCVAQSVLVTFSYFSVTGVVATLAYMTNLVSKKPKTWRDQYVHSAFAWNHWYLVPLAFFPVGATSIYIACALKLGSLNFPSRDLLCDSSSPQWVRFMSYAGMPFLLSIPTLFLSLQSVRRIAETTEHIKRARTGQEPQDGGDSSLRADSYTTFGMGKARGYEEDEFGLGRRKDSDGTTVERDSQSLHFALTPHASRDRSRRSGPPQVASVRFHFPVKPTASLPSDSEQEEIEETTHSRRASATVANPESHYRAGSAADAASANATNDDDARLEDSDSDAPSRPRGLGYGPSQERPDGWAETRSAGSIEESVREGEWLDSERTGRDDDDAESDDMDIHARIAHRRTHSKAFNANAAMGDIHTRRPPPSYLSPTIYRVIVFQISFVIAQLIGCLSTVVDVAKGYSAPTPLGTHHFAMLFVAWGPILTFASLQPVRDSLIPEWVRRKYNSHVTYNK